MQIFPLLKISLFQVRLLVLVRHPVFFLFCWMNLFPFSPEARNEAQLVLKQNRQLIVCYLLPATPS